jgi:hypothetical protein
MRKRLLALASTLIAGCSSTPKTAPTEARIMVAMAGANRGGREVFVQRLDAMGLLPVVDFALQVKADYSGFPEDYKPGEARRVAFERARKTLEWAWSPQPFTHVYYNYEPTRTLEDGSTEHWMITRMLEPATEADTRFIRESVQGVREALKGDPKVMSGAKVGMYYLPRHPRRGSWQPRHYAAAESFASIAGVQDIAHVNCYWTPPSSDEPEDVTRVRVGTAVSYARSYAREAVLTLWPQRGVNNAMWFDRHLRLADELGLRVLIWVHADTPTNANTHADELEPLATMLIKFAGTP